jgi:DNA-binding FadR family transcriptional regulator
MTVPRAKRSLLHQQVADHLIGEIVSGNPLPGEYLESEQRLAEAHGVSRTVMREALMLVSTKGLIVIRHGRGAEVRPREDWNIFDSSVIEALNAGGGVGPILEDLLETRRCIEVPVAELAARRGGDEPADKLMECTVAMDAALADPIQYFSHDVEFHRQLFLAAGNQVIIRLMDPVRELLMTARRHVVSVASQQGLRESNDGHRAIAAAVRDRDPEAARAAMLMHLELTERELALSRQGADGERSAAVASESSVPSPVTTTR